MRVVIDAAAAAWDNSVGVCTAGWLRAWQQVESATGDELHVVASKEFTEHFGLGALPRVVPHEFGGGTRGRIRAQHLAVPALVRKVHADVLLGVVPQIPLRAGKVPVVVVSYDFRHELLPHEFSWKRRAVRRVEYLRAYRRADRIATISDRTRNDLARLHPQWAAKAATVHLGSDRPAGRPATSDRAPVAVAYAHHVNKRPQLVIRAWAAALAHGDSLPALEIVGASPELAPELETLCRQLALPAALVTIHSFLSLEDYTDLLGRARMVVLASTFEGFGLPVVEALRLGASVVITPEPAMMEVGGPAVTVAADESPEALAKAVASALANETDETRAAGIEWAAQFNWATSVAALRQQLVAAQA